MKRFYQPLLLKNLAIRARHLSLGLFAASTVCLLPPSAWGAELIRNGSFELPALLSGTAASPQVPSQWFAPGPLPPLMFNQPRVSWPEAEDGNQYVAIHIGTGGSAPLRQVLSIPTPTAGILTWYDNAAIGVSGTPYDVAVRSLSNPLFPIPRLNVDSVGGATAPDGTPLPWQERFLVVTLETGTYELVFTPRSGGIGVTLLDTVSLMEEDTPANNPPVAVINVSPDADLDGADSEIILISVNGVDAPVTLDGASSSDPDGDTLFHSWSLGVTGEPTVSTRLPIGTHIISLEVSDGNGGSDTAEVSVKVITVGEAIGYLKDMVNDSGLSGYWKRWLRSSLNVAENAFASTPVPGRPSPCQLGKRGLEFFRWLVGALATPGPGDRPAVIPSDLAAELNRLTDEIINSVRCE